VTRRVRAAAALLVLAVVLPLSAALAAPGAAVPNPKPVPTVSEEEMVKRVLDDPRMRRELELRDFWNVLDGKRNASPLWWDADALRKAIDAEVARQNPKASPQQLAAEQAKAWNLFRRALAVSQPQLIGGVLRHDQMPALFKALGWPKERALVEVASLNIPYNRRTKAPGEHSEMRNWRHLERALQLVFGTSDAAKAEISKIMHAAKVGGGSTRAYCTECAKFLQYNPKGTTSFDKNSVSIAAFLKKLEKTAAANRAAAVIELASAQVRRERL
jgi:hypothetical protein